MFVEKIWHFLKILENPVKHVLKIEVWSSHFLRATCEIHKLVVIRFLKIVWKLWDHPFWELARATWITVKFIVEKYDDKNFLIDDVDGVDEQAVQGGAGGQGGQVALQVEQCKSFQVQQGSWSGVEEGELNRLFKVEQVDKVGQVEGDGRGWPQQQVCSGLTLKTD